MLIERLPLRPLGDAIRYLLVTPQIDALLDGEIEFGIFPQVEAERMIAIFCVGGIVRVSRKKTKRRPDIEQVIGHHEVWAICPRKPAPGWRILGRFYEQGVFIALRAWPKERLFGKYDLAAQEVIDDWKELFNSQAPYTAASIGDYLGGVFIDVDEAQ